jgi:hypothetical protein
MTSAADAIQQRLILYDGYLSVYMSMYSTVCVLCVCVATPGEEASLLKANNPSHLSKSSVRRLFDI